MAMRWYSVSVLSNYEKKVAESIGHQVAQEGLEAEIEQVLERRFMPGYVLVRMDMTDRAYHLVNNTNRVTGFLGPQGKPTPLRDAEVNRILKEVEEGAERPRPLIHFQVGENVNVNEGPFEGFAGMVEDVDEENARLKVTVSIFGRATPVELEFGQVTKQT